jgi:uncharacterized protein (DUF1684 family)
VIGRLLLVALVVGAVACGSDALSYEEEILSRRAAIDAFMKSEQSPVPEGERAAFPPLPYYRVDERFRVPAALTVARGGIGHS